MIKAEQILYQLIELNPSHTGGLQQLARVIIDSRKIEFELEKNKSLTSNLDFMSTTNSNSNKILNRKLSVGMVDLNVSRPNLGEAMDHYEKAMSLLKDVRE